MKSLKNKTLWDWMGLLIVPMVLLIGGYFLNQSQITQQNNIEEARITRQIDLDDKRIAEQRRIEDERNYINILNNYRRSITDLMINGGLNDAGYNVASVKTASALTASTAPQLDGERKGQLIIFLFKAHLIMSDNPRVNLAKVDLSKAILTDADLQKIDLRNARLTQVNFTRTNLTDAVLRGADLTDVDFTDAILSGVKLTDTQRVQASLQQGKSKP